MSFFCKICNYSTKLKYNYSRHILSKKHINMIENRNFQEYECKKCKKRYKDRSGLWYHKKKCIGKKKKDTKYKIELEPENESVITMIKQLMDTNERFKNEIIESTKNIKQVINNNNMTINVFLNEHCKDAMNISDFINNIQITEKDIYHSGEVGYIDGIISIFMNKLCDMKYTDRPLHCTDIKRSRFYIKNNDKWERDNDNKIINKTIKKISNKQFDTLCYWVQNNMQNALDNEQIYNQYDKMYSNITHDPTDENHSKILKKLCKLTKFDIK